MLPKVTVIIPAFNAAMYVSNAVKSVLDQDCTAQVEVLVVDDGSSDNTVEVVSGLSARHPQVKLLINNRKKGPSGARNMGLLQASGEFVAFLDADDVWCINHLSAGLELLSSNLCIDVVFFNFELRQYETGEVLGDWFSQKSFRRNLETKEIFQGFSLISGNMFEALLDESFMHLQSMIVRRSVVVGVLFDENVRRSEDRDFSIKMAMTSKARFAFKNLVTGVYYRRGASLTDATVENSRLAAIDHVYLFEKYLHIYSLDGSMRGKIERMLLDRCLMVSYCSRQLGFYAEAARYVFRSFLHGFAPGQLKELAKIILYVVFSLFSRSLKRPVGF